MKVGNLVTPTTARRRIVLDCTRGAFDYLFLVRWLDGRQRWEAEYQIKTLSEGS